VLTFSRPSRRRFLAGTAALAGAAGLGLATGRAPAYGRPLAAPAVPGTFPDVELDLVAAERPTALPAFAGKELPLWTFTPDTWLPVVRMPFGARLVTTIRNALPRPEEHASIHWHGIRVPNDQDGVPYLVQPPVFPGDGFRYSFVPPDTGTFFFHTHCNTAEHIGRGLVGILIVEGDATEPYDADEVVLVRDWRVDVEAGVFLPFTTNRGAGRAGTYGPLRTANGAVNPEMALPAVADCRLRIINFDPTRPIDLGIEGADAAIVAIDGVAVVPFPLDRWIMAPAMRIDVVVRSPADGAVARLVDYRPDDPLAIATLRGAGEPRRTGAFDPAPLRASALPPPDLVAAGTRTITFAAAGEGDAVPPDDPAFGLLGPLCLSFNDFWTIDARSWPGDGHASNPPPLAELTRGRSYRWLLRNTTQHLHPIHIHGHTFAVLGSDKRTLPPHHADTVLLLADETVEVAFVADNPGRWMLHCHIAEHQETGMMAYFTVT